MSELLGQSTNERNTYSWASVNLIDPRNPQTLLTSFENDERVREGAGLDKSEAWPIGARRAQYNLNIVSESARSHIGSAHQSFASREIFIMPSLNGSLKAMQKIGELAKHDIDYVVYWQPERPFAHQVLQTETNNLSVQLDPEMYQRFKATSFKDLLNNKLPQYGLSATLDTNHARRLHRNGTSSPFPEDLRDTIDTILTSDTTLSRIHLATGRLDLPAIDEKHSLLELLDLVNGSNDTGILDTLQHLEKLWRGPVVIEFQRRALEIATGAKTEQDIIARTSEIRETLHTVFEAA